MPSLVLRYSEDPATGLPRLEDESGRLSAAELAALGSAIDRHFEQLARGPDCQRVTLTGPEGTRLPHHFRVHVTERAKRCPTLLLEAVGTPDDAVAKAPHRAPVRNSSERWECQFLFQLGEMLAETDTDQRAPLEFVLSDLRLLLRKDPRRFALLLLTGYL